MRPPKGWLPPYVSYKRWLRRHSIELYEQLYGPIRLEGDELPAGQVYRFGVVSTAGWTSSSGKLTLGIKLRVMDGKHEGQHTRGWLPLASARRIGGRSRNNMMAIGLDPDVMSKVDDLATLERIGQLAVGRTVLGTTRAVAYKNCKVYYVDWLWQKPTNFIRHQRIVQEGA